MRRDQFGAETNRACRDNSARGLFGARNIRRGDFSAQVHVSTTINAKLEYKAIKLLLRVRV